LKTTATFYVLEAQDLHLVSGELKSGTLSHNPVISLPHICY